MIRIISMSQGRQLWEGLTRELGESGWTAQIRGGQMLEDWADPQGEGWTNPNYLGGAPNENPDRVWLHFDPLRGGQNMEADLDSVIHLIRERIADVPIVFSLVFGLDGHTVCSGNGQRSTSTHRDFSSRLVQWAQGKDRVAVVDLHVACSDFVDQIGHLVDGSGERAAAEAALAELSRIDNAEPEPEPPPVSVTPFVDIEGNTHEADILWIADRGITKGANPPDNDEYRPDLPVERDQMASFFRRGLEPIEGRLAGVETDIADHIFDHPAVEAPPPTSAGPGAHNVENQSELFTALNALDDGRGGVINFYGGAYRDVVVDVPNILFRRAGRKPTFVASAGKPALHLRFGADNTIIEAGFDFDTDANSALRTYGILCQADKEVRVTAANFRGFGRNLNQSVPWQDAPMGLRVIGITPHPNPGASVPSVWSDWHHFDRLHFEFVYSGFGMGEAANAMCSRFVVRQFYKNALWQYTGGPGADDGAMYIDGYWVVSPEDNQTMVMLEREAGARRNGAAVLLGGRHEAGKKACTHVAVQSDTNLIMPANFMGGTVGFDWQGEARDNRWFEPAVRSSTGGIGPPVDQGNIPAQSLVG